MCDDLAQRVADQFERHVDSLVAAYKSGKILAPNPLLNRPFSIDDIPKLKYLVRNALRARAWFGKYGPSWGQPLPLSDCERIGFFFDTDYTGNRGLHLVARYSVSLQARDFDYLSHPGFFDYARGVMASERGRDYVLMDPTLQAEFPPKEIAGLDEYGRWRPLRHRESRFLENQMIYPRALIRHPSRVSDT